MTGIEFSKIADAAEQFSQCALYNYVRMIERGDEVTAQLMLSDGLKAAMRLYHYICNVYPKDDESLLESTGELPGGEKIADLIAQVQSQFMRDYNKLDVCNVIEKLASALAQAMYDKGFISDIDLHLDVHMEELLFKASIVDNTKDELVDKIVKLEFKAFDKVKNEGGRAYCQDDWTTFSIMRKSQYMTWDKNMLIQYYYDFSREYKRGHNLITEKYGRMMESTDSERWNEIKDYFPSISEEKMAVIDQIVAVQVKMMEDFSNEYPKTACNARSLYSCEDSLVNTSYETYLRGEISTYSDKMLQLYGRYVVQAYQTGENIPENIMGNTAKLYGFSSLSEFENVK